MSRRSLPPALLVVLILVLAPSAFSHDLFLKLADYFPAPNRRIAVTVLNGTFTTSENAISRDRLRDVSLVAGGRRTRLDTTAWTSTRDSISSRVSVELGSSATYVLGASTRPRDLTLNGKDFAAYLAEEGLEDVVEARRRSGELGDSASERYAKHVKAIFQVGPTRTADFGAQLGYPAEVIPQSNPYELKAGDSLSVRCLLDGFPAAGVAVLAGGRSSSGARIAPQTVRADENGIARIRLSSAGTWYVKFIGMRRLPDPKAKYESKWGTLTFGIR